MTPRVFIITIASIMIACFLANVIAGNPKIEFNILTSSMLGMRFTLFCLFAIALIRGSRVARYIIAVLLIMGGCALGYVGIVGYEEKYSSSLICNITGLLNLGCGIALLTPFAGRYFRKAATADDDSATQ